MTPGTLEFVPFIQAEEKVTIKKELEGKFVSVVFNGMSHLCEVLAVVLLFTSVWTIQQGSVQLKLQ